MSRQKSIFTEPPISATDYLPAYEAVADGHDRSPDAAPQALVALLPPAPPAPFELELRRLVRRRLSGELGFEEFCRLNLELHFRHGRSGYDLDQYERDIREFRERQRRIQRRHQFEQALQSKRAIHPRHEEEPPQAVGA